MESSNGNGHPAEGESWGAYCWRESGLVPDPESLVKMQLVKNEWSKNGETPPLITVEESTGRVRILNAREVNMAKFFIEVNSLANGNGNGDHASAEKSSDQELQPLNY